MKINKSDLAAFLNALQSEYQVIAPVAEKGGIVYKTVASADEVKTNFLNAKVAPKGVFFPQAEKMISYEVKGKDVEVNEHLDQAKKVLFAVRPCDAKSVTLLDKVFQNDQYRDPYYCDRRDNTVVVGLGCNQPAPTCFCSSLGIGPFATEGSDVFLVDIGDAYVVEAVTEKGKAFLQQATGMEAANELELAKAADTKKAVSPSQVDVEGITRKLDSMFSDTFWDTLYEKCLGCNACSYTCPTCHCFDISEEVKDNKGCRVRTWDACMAPLFTLHGSGHNPRDNRKARWRQRLMHKFNYFVHNNGDIACVGCGRCIKNCPVNMDIRQVVADVQRVGEARVAE